MPTLDMITEQSLEVDYDNAVVDAEALNPPNFQLLTKDKDYCLKYVANLLAKAQCLEHELRTYKRVETAVNAAYQGHGWHAQADSPDPQIGDDPF